MSLRQTVCPSRLINLTRELYLFAEDFEDYQSDARSATVPAFCGYYSLHMPYWFNFPTIIDVVRYPNVSFLIYSVFLFFQITAFEENLDVW